MWIVPTPAGTGPPPLCSRLADSVEEVLFLTFILTFTVDRSSTWHYQKYSTDPLYGRPPPPTHPCCLWRLAVKHKNTIRRCVPTRLPEYSAIIANSPILPPLQPAAAACTRVHSCTLSFKFKGAFSRHTGAGTKSNYSNLFMKRRAETWVVETGC